MEYNDQHNISQADLPDNVSDRFRDENPSLEESAGADPVTRLRQLLGDNAVLIPCPSGKKGPQGVRGWQTWTTSETEAAHAEGRFNDANIAVLLGEETGLYAFDIDDDEALKTFTVANSTLNTTFRVDGNRGAKLVVRADEPPPWSGKDVKCDGATVCELLTRNATVSGTHPEGIQYRDNGQPAMEIRWLEIRWPDRWELPGQRTSGTSTYRPDPLILPSAEEPEIQPAAEEIFERIAPTKTLFLRGGKVVEIQRDNDDLPILSLVSAPAFCSRLENYGDLMKWVSGGQGNPPVLKPAGCSEELAKKLLAALQVEGLPRIKMIATGPVATEDSNGLQVLGDGFHEIDGSHGIFVRNTVRPDLKSLSVAREIIAELLADFRFVTEADYARAVASLISPVIKMAGLLNKEFPLNVGEATESQTGKGFFFTLASAIYGERPGLVGQRNGGVGGFDESLSARLIEGRPFVLFDNLRGRLDSAFLEMVLTAPASVPCRVPHRGEIPVDCSGVTFMLTSNGLETTRDLANRANIIRLRKKKGSFREYPEGDILEHVRQNRGRFIGAVLAVVADWVRLGKPLSPDTRGPGAFRRWWQMVDYICTEILELASPLDGLHDAAERTSNPGLQWLRAICLAVEEDGRFGEPTSATGLVEVSQEHGIPIPGVRDEGSGAEKIVGGIMRRVFDEESEREIDDWIVTRATQAVQRDDKKGNIQMKVYTINKRRS